MALSKPINQAEYAPNAVHFVYMRSATHHLTFFDMIKEILVEIAQAADDSTTAQFAVTYYIVWQYFDSQLMFITAAIYLTAKGG